MWLLGSGMMMMMMYSFARCSSLYIYAAMRECCQACRQLEGGRQPTGRPSGNSPCEFLINRPRIERRKLNKRNARMQT